MPNIPCAIKIDCECSDSPYANLSSEAPDLPVNTTTYYWRGIPPLGSSYGGFTCQSTCQSAASLEAAILCAAEQALLCGTGTWRQPDTGGGSQPPVPPAQSPRGGRPYPAFTNTPQVGSSSCADGLPFLFAVPAGIFAGRNQATADKAAKSYATRQAQLRRVCLSAQLHSPSCGGEPYKGTITATGAFLAKGADVDHWSLVGGTLPPGVTFNGGAIRGGTVTLTGTPTKPGSYFFIVQVVDPKGDTMAKGFTLVIAGVTNADALPEGTVNAPYSAQLTAAGFTTPIFSIGAGSLPDGLSLSASGLISGTPTTAQTVDVTFQVEEDDDL